MSAPTFEHVTFLFTDLEESTRLWDEYPDAMRAALARHDAILEEAIEVHRGSLVQSMGDGVYARFDRATDAVAAAAAAVKALIAEPWGPTGPLRARMGIHTGPARADGQYSGPVLNRTSRLMAAAHGGQIVLSQLTADQVRSTLPDELRLLDLGEHRLRGLARPEHVYELVLPGAPSEFPPLRSVDAILGTLTLPGPAFARFDEELAGRNAELEHLASSWKEAATGVRQVALLGGEPGIGKTRLAGELSRRVDAQDDVVLYGRCDEEMIVPHQPFVEALRPWVAAYSPATLHERLHGLEQDLARAFPELLGRMPEPSAPASTDPEAERYRFFEAVTTLITGIAATRPTVLVLDDLHWADKPTILLLRHLVRAAAHARLLIVVCYRDVGLDRDHPLTDLLADLRREPFVTRVALGGLSEVECGELLTGLAGHEIAPPLVTALHRETAGNPFFLEELLRHLIETNLLPTVPTGGAQTVDLGALDLPDSVRDVVARRLSRLPDSVHEILTLAAVMGPEFDAGLLGRAADASPVTVLEALDIATDAGLVKADPSRMGRYAFGHALIRQTLTAALGTARRAELHARVGTAIEDAGDSPHAAAELALHFTYALPLIGAGKAIGYTTQAGRDALADVAFEDAAAYFESALHLYEEYSPTDHARKVELLTDLASALVYVDEQAGVGTALRAVDAARTDGSATQFGRAVAVFVEPMYGVIAYPAEVTALFDEARAVLGPSDGALRARLLAFEAFKYAVYQLRGRDGRALAAEAVEIARSIDDPLTLADALFALAVSLEGSIDIDQRLALGEELIRLADPAGARAAAFGLRVLAGARLEQGDAGALTATIDRLARTGDEMRWLPAHVYAAQWRATQALLEGRFDDAQRHGTDLRRYSRAYRAATSMHLIQTFLLTRERGELANLQGLEETADEHVRSLLTIAMLALVQLESGDENGARLGLERIAAEDFQRGPGESTSGAGLGILAEVAAHGGAPETALALYELLAPFEGRLLTVVLGLVCVGAADRYLGMLCTVLERWDEADAHFGRAIELEERARGHALLPRTRYWWAHSLLARGRDSERATAESHLAQVIDDTDRLGMHHLHAQAVALRAG